MSFKLKMYLWKVFNSIQRLPIFPPFLRTILLNMTGCQMDPSARIEEYVYLGSNHIKMGKKTIINVGAFLDGCGEIILEDQARCGPYVRILTGTHEWTDNPDFRVSEDLIMSSVHIKKGAWVGMGVTILPGVTIAEGCVIGSNSLVTKDTEPNGLYVGSPAKRVKDLPVKKMDKVG